MTEVDYYETVRQKLTLGPLYAPKHKEMFKLLKLFWSEEEIKLLSHFEGADKSNTLKELADKSGMAKPEIKKLLERSVINGTISKLGTKYYLLPIIPGIFEHYFINRKDSEGTMKEVAKLYRDIINEFLPQLVVETDFNLFRPILPLEAKEKLIKVDESMEVNQEVVPYDLVQEMIDKYDIFASIPCQCRLIAELDGELCKVAPAELGCFLAGPSALKLIGDGIATQMNKEEALVFLKKVEKAGLIHNRIADKGIESTTVICNCCGCHCGSIHPLKIARHYNDQRSNYLPQIDNELCKKCELCRKKCQMSAINHHLPNLTDKSDEYMYIREEFCMGCGICAVNCPNGAIKMFKVRDKEPVDKHMIGNRTFFDLLM